MGMESVVLRHQLRKILIIAVLIAGLAAETASVVRQHWKILAHVLKIVLFVEMETARAVKRPSLVVRIVVLVGMGVVVL